jgi:hypothetical protein
MTKVGRAQPLDSDVSSPVALAAFGAAAAPTPVEAEAFLAPLLATGAPRWEAIGLGVQALGEATFRPWWDAYLDAYLSWTCRPYELMAALEGVALGSPEAANAWLGAALARGEGLLERNLAGLRWFTSLPDGFKPADRLALNGTGLEALPAGFVVPGYLDLEDSRLVALPEGLAIGGYLSLTGTPIVALPKGLRVEGMLILTGCPSWDGCVPACAHVKVCLRTDQHPKGIALGNWRQLHPEGERAPAPQVQP